jgi:protein-tyrosine phosphatase
VTARTKPLRLLVVCTGNLCRSPLAASLLRQALGGSAAVEVSSAGTRARPGLPMPDDAVRTLAELGGPVDPSFRSRRLSAALIAEADLVLTAERAHRDVVASLERGAWARTFTLVELARLLDGAGAGPQDLRERAVLLTARAARQRGLHPAARPQDDDVEDPMGRPAAVFRRSGAQLAASASVVAAALLGRPAPPSGPAPASGRATAAAPRRWRPWS